MGVVTLPVSEVFGPVWQGEGPHAGRRVSFLRLGLCNLHCEWCDTPYTWDDTRFDLGAECPPMDADAILAALRGHRTDTLVLTGGEPTIHGHNETLHEVIDRSGMTVHVETNGTRIPHTSLAARVAVWAVSPKWNQDADPPGRRLRPEAVSWFAAQPGAFLKVVCRDESDVRMVAKDLDTGMWGDWEGRVWAMPEGVTADEVTGTALNIADAVARYGWNLTLRQHTLMYGTERAR